MNEYALRRKRVLLSTLMFCSFAAWLSISGIRDGCDNNDAHCRCPDLPNPRPGNLGYRMLGIGRFEGILGASMGGVLMGVYSTSSPTAVVLTMCGFTPSSSSSSASGGWISASSMDFVAMNSDDVICE
jgi:hypothetical protein